jgi:hypothetical protein
VKNEDIQIGEYFKRKYFEVELCAQIVLQRKQKEFDQIWKMGNLTTRELAVRHYNIWAIDSKDIGYSIQNRVGFGQHSKIMNILMQSDVEYLNKTIVPLKYFVKLVSQNMEALGSFLLDQ